MRGLALAAMLLAACASQRAEPPAASAAPAVAPAASPAAAPHTAPAPMVTPAPAAAVPGPSGAPAPIPAAAPAPAAQPALGHGRPQVGAVPAANALVPPETEGTSRSAIAGCLLAASEAEAARFPPPPVLRSAAPKVTVAPTVGGALVTHELEHACCLKGGVSSRLDGRVAIVRERLVGTPCRCRCASTLRTAVALPPGRWTVAVDVEEAGAVRRVHDQQVEVR